MSVKSLSPRTAVLIAVLVIAGAGVTVLNIKTFGVRGGFHQANAARAQAYAVLPADLGELVRLAGQDLRGPEHQTKAEPTTPEAPVRDPFVETTPAKPATGITHAVSRRTRRKSKSPGLVCSAVLLGGRAPLVMISGKTYRLQDQVAGYTVIDISARGAVLENKEGKRKTLTIGGGDIGSFSVSVGSEDLAARINTERKEP